MELIILLQFIDFGIIQFNRIYVLRILCLIVMPEYEFPRISRKLSIQQVSDLFQVKLSHISASPV